MVAVAVAAVFATEVAVMVTVFPVGTAAGAVNTVDGLFPLAVDGLTLPHVALPQVTVQVTPALEVSLETAAVIVAVVPITMDAGAFEITTEIVAGGLFPPPPPHAARNRPRAAIAETNKFFLEFISLPLS
jgi:hypothetical protein